MAGDKFIQKHCCKGGIAADKGCTVLTSDPRPDATVLYPGCTLESILTATFHKSLSPCRGVTSETDFLCASEVEIIKGFLTRVFPRSKQNNSPQIYQTYAQVTKPTVVSTTTQTDQNIISKYNLPSFAMSETRLFCELDAYIVFNACSLLIGFINSSAPTSFHIFNNTTYTM
ncbi:hypothetical protein TNCV_4377691 [Trichonephila clavipes]|nr:hypothetical protein TNCV_4377691 [Trichonephila clavipes]